MLHIVCGGSVLFLFWYALHCVLSSFAIILKRRRELVALLLLSYGCLVTVNAFQNTLICVSYAAETQRTYNALETHTKRKFAGQIREL